MCQYTAVAIQILYIQAHIPGRLYIHNVRLRFSFHPHLHYFFFVRIFKCMEYFFSEKRRLFWLKFIDISYFWWLDLWKIVTPVCQSSGTDPDRHVILQRCVSQDRSTTDRDLRYSGALPQRGIHCLTQRASSVSVYCNYLFLLAVNIDFYSKANLSSHLIALILGSIQPSVWSLHGLPVFMWVPLWVLLHPPTVQNMHLGLSS